MPSLHHAHEAQHADRTPARAIATYASPILQRPPPDYNRPLPPPPGSSVDNYDIPALRRKPLPNEAPSPQAHTRSFSHPFPSIFSSRKNDKRSRTDTRDHSTDEPQSSRPANALKDQPATTLSGKQEPVTGKCMTCDATVRWPQGLKVFRCTTCLTINDLEPFTEPSPAPQGGPHVRRPVPISLEKTRALIDDCLGYYLSQQIQKPQSTPNGVREEEEPPLDEDRSNGTGLFTAFFNDDSPPPTPRPLLKVRSTSDPNLTLVRPRRREERPSISNQQRALTSGLDEHRTRVLPSQPVNGSSGMNEDHNLAVPIFRAVENYVADAFIGCSALNSSFFSVKPHRQGNAPSERPARKQQSEPTITPSFEPDVFLSDLDAKTLLVGDIAENGSWWTGGRSFSLEKDNTQNRQQSPERWQGIVNAKTPRINWYELAEWYRVIITAGDQWRRKWSDLQRTLDNDSVSAWNGVSLDTLEQAIMSSQTHLQRSLLKSTENLLKRPRRPLKHPEDCRFLLMLLFNPLIYPSEQQAARPVVQENRSTESRQTRPPHGQAMPRRRAPGSLRNERNLGHHSGIIKRVLGLLANVPNDIHQFLVSWVSRFSDHHFQRTVELIGSFVTYRLSRQQRRPAPEQNDPTAGLIPSFSNRQTSHPSQLHAQLDPRASAASTKAHDGRPQLSVYGEDWQIRAASRVMSLLFQANLGHTARKRDVPARPEQRLQNPALNAKCHAQAHGQIVPVSVFYNSVLDYADLVADFEAWESTKTKFTFCQYPFFLSIYAKIHILEHDARRQMEVKAREAFFDSILSRKAVSQYLVLRVRRDCLVEDSLRSVSEVVGSGGGDIKKGLRIDFVGEEGIDAGGLRKEWFLLLVREIFDPDHGLFVYDEDSQYCYFNPYCFESSEQFFLVGVLLGLAIYNSTILDVAFPPFVFKKMLASAPSTGDKLTSTPRVTHGYTLEDLAELRPALAKGLRQLLDFDGDVEETFCRDFVVEMDRYGDNVEVPLCTNGEKRAVTNSNRKEFVDLYTRYLLDTAVTRQYEPFKRGFFTVCGGNALSLFRPEEIELLVRGSDEPLDIASLKAVALYEGWPKPAAKSGSREQRDPPPTPPDQQPQVIWFWDFFARATPIDQRKILSFITGSDRIPAMGAANLVIKVQMLIEREDELKPQNTKKRKGSEDKEHGPERFPIARTCFNSIGLYQYTSRRKLEEKLWMAVTESEGFGLK